MLKPSRSASLGLRLLASGGVLVLLAVFLVGYALDRSFIQATEQTISQRLTIYFYNILADLEVSDSGQISLSQEISDPRLGMPGSGLYIIATTTHSRWQSPSTLGLELPAIPQLDPGQSRFLQPTGSNKYYRLANAIVWELDNGIEVPMQIMVLEQRADADKVIASFRRGLIRWLGGMAALLLLAQFLLIRWALRPLVDISDKVAAIEAGDSSELAGSFPAELQPLTDNINLLLASEERNRKQYRHDLDALAHGLKTPLAIISASLEGVDSRLASAGLNTISTAVADMQALISRHLEVASLATRRLHAQKVNIAVEVKRLSKSLKTIYPQVNIQSTVPANLVFRGDQRDLLELLGNLMENACKYGAGEVRVSATAQAADSQLKIRVEDNGKGIASDRIKLLSRRGVRGDEAGSGHGLGLSIVRHLVEAYGGHLTIKTSPLGGARITISLPLSN